MTDAAESSPKPDPRLFTSTGGVIAFVLSALLSLAAAVWSGLPSISTLMHYRDANGWDSMGLLFFVFPGSFAGMILSRLPFWFFAHRMSRGPRIALNALSLLAATGTLLALIVGWSLSGRGGC